MIVLVVGDACVTLIHVVATLRVFLKVFVAFVYSAEKISAISIYAMFLCHIMDDYATNANSGNAAIIAERFGIVFVGWLLRYSLIKMTRSMALAS